MDEIIVRSVERAIETMRRNLGDKLTVDDLARAAAFSKFHFTRVFRQVTGLTPGRFLATLRIEEAKRLLLTTSLPVTAISGLVGYQSVGTFSTRFSAAVGLAPTVYRRRRTPGASVSDARKPGADSSCGVRGRVVVPTGQDERIPVFVGLFPSRCMQGRPAGYVIADAVGHYDLGPVPQGTWHVMAHCAGGESGGPEPLVAALGPIITKAGVSTWAGDVRLRRRLPVDPPALTALVDSVQTDTAVACA